MMQSLIRWIQQQWRTNSIMRKNVQLMLSLEEGGMMHLITLESIGGNADIYKGYPCVAANFYYNNQTGEIIVFQNKPLRGEQISKGFVRIVLRKEDQKYTIIDIAYEQKNTTKEARKNVV